MRVLLLIVGLLIVEGASAQPRWPYDALAEQTAVLPLHFEAPALHRTTPAPAPLPAGDAWFGFDKVQHFTFSFLLTVGGQYVLVNKADLGEGPALPVSAGISAGIGLAKEVYDHRRPGGTGFSVPDMAWNAAGIAAASVLILL